MERKEAIKYQQAIDEFMDSAKDRKWLADCVLKSSPAMTNEHCRMIEITLADGKGCGFTAMENTFGGL